VDELISLRVESLRWLETGGEVIALDELSLLYLGTNESGSLLWQELASGTTREHLVDRLVEAFGIDAAAAGADVDRFLGELDRRGLLTR
jgi:hypothetical protein